MPSTCAPKKTVRVTAILSADAQQDLRDILRWSELKFGSEAARRYRGLMLQALRDLESDAERPGTRERPELMVSGARTYHLSYSRDRAGQPGVKKPRHFILYRFQSLHVLEIARILHDRSDLSRHLPEEYRDAAGERG